MDWWDAKRLAIPDLVDHKAQPSNPETAVVDITCTPCQHFTGRRIVDNYKSLWSGWAIEEVLTPSQSQQAAEAQSSERSSPVKVYFGGDTGYRRVPDFQDEAEVPVCPVFKEIGEKFGGFDFAMIPIGYVPS